MHQNLCMDKHLVIHAVIHNGQTGACNLFFFICGNLRCIQEDCTDNMHWSFSFCYFQANTAPGKLSAMVGPEGFLQSGCFNSRGTLAFKNVIFISIFKKTSLHTKDQLKRHFSGKCYNAALAVQGISNCFMGMSWVKINSNMTFTDFRLAVCYIHKPVKICFWKKDFVMAFSVCYCYQSSLQIDFITYVFKFLLPSTCRCSS